MESVSLATITTAVVTLAMDAAKNLADTTLQRMWSDVKGWLGWNHEVPAAPELPAKVAEKLNSDEALARKIVEYLQAAPATYSCGSQVRCKTFVQSYNIQNLTINS